MAWEPVSGQQMIPGPHWGGASPIQECSDHWCLQKAGHPLRPLHAQQAAFMSGLSGHFSPQTTNTIRCGFGEGAG